jgi:hypothetical protein
MEYPSEIESLRAVLLSLPGVTQVEAQHTPLEELQITDLTLPPLGDLPHAALRRSGGGLPGEALGQIFVRFTPSAESWLTLEFLSWQVRDWSRSGKNVQIRTRGLPPVLGRIQLGSTLGVIIEFFVDGLEKDPMALLKLLEDFGRDTKSSFELYGLKWTGGVVRENRNP